MNNKGSGEIAVLIVTAFGVLYGLWWWSWTSTEAAQRIYELEDRVEVLGKQLKGYQKGEKSILKENKNLQDQVNGLQKDISTLEKYKAWSTWTWFAFWAVIVSLGGGLGYGIVYNYRVRKYLDEGKMDFKQKLLEEYGEIIQAKDSQIKIHKKEIKEIIDKKTELEEQLKAVKIEHEVVSVNLAKLQAERAENSSYLLPNVVGSPKETITKTIPSNVVPKKINDPFGSGFL